MTGRQPARTVCVCGMNGLGLANARLDSELTVGRKEHGIQLVLSLLASVQIIAIYHQSRRKTQSLEALTRLIPSPRVVQLLQAAAFHSERATRAGS